MRSQFLQCATIAEAEMLAPWSAMITEVEGGYRAWESITDYETWLAQQ